MNPRVVTVLALLALIAACSCFFLPANPSPQAATDANSQRTDKAAAPQPMSASKENAVRANPGSEARKKPAVDWKRFNALMNMDASSGAMIPEVTEGDIGRFLAGRGESAINLIAAFEKTSDRRWLDRALELFPNNPAVLMLAVQTSPVLAEPRSGEPYRLSPEHKAVIDRFKAADPNNPLPWIFSAQEFFKAKQTAEGVAEIRAALERPAFYTYSNERIDATQRLYEDMGIHPIEAGLFAMAGLAMPQMTAAQQASRSLMEWQKSAADSGDTAAANEALRLTYNLGRTFSTPEASRTLIGQLVGISMETRALKALPADTQPAWLTVDPAQRVAEMEKQKQTAKEIASGFDWVIRNQNEEVLSEYLRRMRSGGEPAAYEWLKGQKK